MQNEKIWLTQLKNSRNWFNKNSVERTLEALNKNGFNSIYAPTKEEAMKEILELIPKGKRIGVGGSMSVREIGLVDALKERGEQLDDIWEKKYSSEEDFTIRLRHFGADVFLTSSNAVTEDGKLINIDGLGNRVAAMVFGPKKVIVVVGTNKIVKDVHEGIDRIRNVAAPMNVMRFEGKTSCTQTGKCNLDECKPPDRHCHVISIIEKRPMKTDTTVVIIGEKLGF